MIMCVNTILSLSMEGISYMLLHDSHCSLKLYPYTIWHCIPMHQKPDKFVQHQWEWRMNKTDKINSRLTFDSPILFLIFPTSTLGLGEPGLHILCGLLVQDSLVFNDSSVMSQSEVTWPANHSILHIKMNIVCVRRLKMRNCHVDQTAEFDIKYHIHLTRNSSISLLLFQFHGS